MQINRIPAGWGDDQLAALNELDDWRDAVTLIKDVATALGDTSPEATRVRADVLAEARAVWDRIKTFPPAPPAP